MLVNYLRRHYLCCHYLIIVVTQTAIVLTVLELVTKTYGISYPVKDI